MLLYFSGINNDLSRTTKSIPAAKNPPINTGRQQRVETKFHLEFYDYSNQQAISN